MLQQCCSICLFYLNCDIFSDIVLYDILICILDRSQELGAMLSRLHFPLEYWLFKVVHELFYSHVFCPEKSVIYMQRI
jgi:hypothetical protein